MPARLRVMVVDNESAVCEYFTALLTPDEYDLDTRTDPFEALAQLEAEHYHLLILDLRMPGMSGDELLEQLRQFDRKIAVILISAYPTLQAKTPIDELDVSDFLPKPFSGSHLRERIAQIMRERGILGE